MILTLFLGGCEDKLEPKDCDGISGGTAFIDQCGECVGGTTNKSSCVEDCNGDWGGTAYVNACEYCVGGKTDLSEMFCDDAVDIDGNVYKTVAIGSQVWFAENLMVTKYKDGTPIPTGLSNSEWTSTESGDAYAIFEGWQNSVPDTFGYLYNWEAVHNSKGIAPEGWRVSNDEDWIILYNFLEEKGFAGKKGTALKATHTWCCTADGGTGTNGFGTDNFEFSALPGGCRNKPYTRTGAFDGIYEEAFFWRTRDENEASAVQLTYKTGETSGHTVGKDSQDGLSIRCVKE